MEKICIIGQMAPPMNGLSKALEILVDSSLVNQKYELKKIDIKKNKFFLINIFRILMSKSDKYYITIAQTKLGNIRDLIILFIIFFIKRKEIIIHYHGGYFAELFDKEMNSVQKKANIFLLNRVEKIIVLSEGLKKIFDNVIKDPNKLYVCENFIEEKVLLSKEEIDLKMQQLSKKDTINFLYLSNFIKTKGYMELLKAIQLLSVNNAHLGEKYKFHFAGHFFNKESEKEFNSFIKNNSLSSLIVYHGTVSGERKKNLLRDTHVFILPTVYPKEGQPISIIEAMGSAQYIVSTNHAGIPDIINEKNGHLMKSNDFNEIYKSILDLPTEKNDLINICLHNRQYTLNNFKETHYINKMLKIFGDNK